jgi:phosphoglycolate phosphatase
MNLIGLDLDGTLEDSRQDMVSAATQVRAQLGLPVRGDTQLRPWVNAGMDALYRACFDDYLAQGDATARFAAVREAYEAEYLAHVAVATRLYNGMAEALVALSKLGTLACITNKPEHISRKLLDELGVGALFATVVGGDTCAHAKPHPIMLRTAAERCAFHPPKDRAFMIGDTAADIKLAHAFGATSIWCAWGYAAQLDSGSETPHFEALTPHDLPGIVAR